MKKILVLLFLVLLTWEVQGREVPISSLPNDGKLPQAQAAKFASQLATAVKKTLPFKNLNKEFTNVMFIPKNELIFEIVEHGLTRTEEEEAIQNCIELNRASRGMVSELLSANFTQGLCRDKTSYGRMMRTLLVSGIVIQYHYFIGDNFIGIGTVTKNSLCLFK